ncbi:MAG: hypothetical protein RIS76_1421 [Verrucomicrobiota bacterium]|jgi:hypothetical protein
MGFRSKWQGAAGIWVLVVGLMMAVQGADPATNRPLAALQSSSPARSLAMLLQVVHQLEQYVQTKNLSSIHNEDEILSAASTELLTQAHQVNAAAAEEFKAALTVFCQQVSRLHLSADLSRQAQSEARLGEVLTAFQKVKGYFPERILAAAQPSIDTFTCSTHPDVYGVSGDYCPKCGSRLDQFCRILPSGSGFAHAGQQTIRATVTPTAPLEVGQPVTILLRLQRTNGLPVLPADLIETHTARIHVLVIDGSLTDYHHEHPQPTKKPGEYTFGFTPRKPGNYRVWVDMRPYPLGLQEYAVTDIPAATAGEPLSDRATVLKRTVDGLNYELISEAKTVQVGKPAPIRLRITDAEGKGFAQLEPIMASFTHMVGFNEDGKNVLHLHPKGPPVTDAAARGGPELDFLLYALRPGFVRLFAQVQIGGKPVFVPFGLQVEP